METTLNIDYRALFAALPSPYMIVDRELRYVDVNAAYERAVGRTREELIGKGIFELFPNEGEGGRLLRASLERVFNTGAPESIAYIPYAIPRPAGRGGGMEMHYWSAVHTPLQNVDGDVAFILQNTVDVTELRQLKQIAFGPSDGPSPPMLGETQLLQRAAEVQQTNLSLMEETTQLRDLFMQAPGFMAVMTGPDLTFSFVNKAYLQVVGARQLIGRPVAECLPELAEQGYVSLLRQAMARREPVVRRGMSVRLKRSSDGPLEERFVDFVFQPILGADGAAAGVFVEGSDVTDRVRGEVQQKLLVDELNHRVKNTLATVQSIAAQTLRTSPNPEDFRKAFEARLMALSSAHDLLTASSWRQAGLRDVILIELRPHGIERYRLDGPDVPLAPAEALRLSLIFHELATNAAKYGALANTDGCVRVSWRVEPGPEAARLVLDWSEVGGPPVTSPTRRGFGSRLIERSLQAESGGAAVMTYASEGLRCRLSVPLQGVE
jgi:PAS domain S-box-containing protein